MTASTVLTDSLMAVANQPVLLVLVIVVATFVLEDVATVTVALLASHMAVDATVAVAALVAGTVLGDLAVFYVAKRAAHLPMVARLLGGATLKPVIGWLERNALGMVVLARFTPGLRLPVFAGAGSIGVPFRRFAVVVALSTLVWTPALFWAAESLGMAGLQRLGMYGWLLPVALIAAMALAPRIVSGIVSRRELVAAPSLALAA
jgi:membrane protein DedA with SNARE-associated domain